MQLHQTIRCFYKATNTTHKLRKALRRILLRAYPGNKPCAEGAVKSFAEQGNFSLKIYKLTVCRLFADRLLIFMCGVTRCQQSGKSWFLGSSTQSNEYRVGMLKRIKANL